MLVAVVLLATCVDDPRLSGPTYTAEPLSSVSSASTLLTTTGTAVTLVGAGDIASCTKTGDEATAKLLDSIAGTVFTAGDNASAAGADSDFTNCYAPTWGRHNARTLPAPGRRHTTARSTLGTASARSSPVRGDCGTRRSPTSRRTAKSGTTRPTAS